MTTYKDRLNSMAVSDEEKRRHTIIINNWESRCGNCGGGATPSERAHLTQLPGYSGKGTQAGCGTEFRYVASDYFGMGSVVGHKPGTTKAYFAECYPDLEWAGFDEEAMMETARRIYEENNTSI